MGKFLNKYLFDCVQEEQMMAMTIPTPDVVDDDDSNYVIPAIEDKAMRGRSQPGAWTNDCAQEP
jgi:hypothetical protein